jgi:hypothetical protein
MPTFQVSPGVQVREIDLTGGIPAVSTTEGATVSVMRWGPLNKRVLVDSEPVLVQRFGRPTNLNAENWFNAASFLAYANKLYVTRVANTAGVFTAANGMGFSTSPTLTCTTSSGNATITTTNTASLLVGMVLIGGSNVAISTTISSITNSTAFVVSSNAAVTGSGSSALQWVHPDIAFTAVANTTAAVANLANQVVLNEDDYYRKDTDDSDNVTAGRAFDSDVLWVARYPGALGNSLRISVCDTATGFTSQINLASYANGTVMTLNVGSNTATVTVSDTQTNATAQTSVNTAYTTLKGLISVTDNLEFGNSSIGYQSLKVTSISNTVTITSNATVTTGVFTISLDDELKLVANQTLSANVTRYWEFYDLFESAPGTSDYVRSFGNSSAVDELHVVVVDDKGAFTGIPGEILEVYKNVSRARDAKNLDGGTNFYKDVINDSSKYIWWARDRSTARSNTANWVATASNNAPLSLTFVAGTDGSTEANVALGILSTGWDLYSSAEEVDVSILIAGKARGGTAGGQMANYIIDNICEKRKDCVVFISPDKADVVNNFGNEVEEMVTFRNSLRTTSYAFMDSGYKYMYDRYNDIFRWVPLNGDMGGLAVRTDATNDPWWSFAGFTRGQIKNVVRLAFNPRKAQRDELYKSNINPVVTFPGEGTLLFGDKTLLTRPSAFDRINVRRLFIVLEKAISTYAKYLLFEFNDEFTRAQFRNVVVPYLRDVKSRRGITDFVVVCDKTNNPGEVIDRNEFVGDIYIKPARSINYITLNFVAVRTDVNFSEVIGKF